jgi:arylsulfatase A-like enzyme
MNAHRSHVTRSRLSVMKTLASTRFVLAVCFAVHALPAAEPIRPNIVIFLADDLSRTDRSIYNPRSDIDLTADPHELRNLAADPAQARRLAQLRRELDAMMQAEGDEASAAEDARRPKQNAAGTPATARAR